jgi:hypothetical protein
MDNIFILHLPITYSRILELKGNPLSLKEKLVQPPPVINNDKIIIDSIKNRSYEISVKESKNLLENKSVCWWCTHDFEGDALYCPDKYIGSTDKFVVSGCFCSFNCILSYKMEKKDNNCHLVSFMNKKITGEYVSIHKAPSRYCLEKYGGPITIENYRKTFRDNSFIKIIKPPFIFNPQCITQGTPSDLIKKNINKLDCLKKVNHEKILLPKKEVKTSIKKPKTIGKILGFN